MEMVLEFLKAGRFKALGEWESKEVFMACHEHGRADLWVKYLQFRDTEAERRQKA